MQENRVGLIISFISLGCVVLLVIAFGNLYQKQREHNSRISVLDLGYRPSNTADFQNLQRKIDDLDRRVSSGGATQSNTTDSYLTRIESTLIEMAEKYFLEKNSTIVNGALRLGLRESLIFSFDIPASIYREFHKVHYLIPSKDGHNFIFTNSKQERLNLWVSSHYGEVGLVTASCQGNYPEDIKVAAGIFKQRLEEEVRDKDVSKWEKFDFCKYVTKEKAVNATYWSFLDEAPALSSPNLPKDTFSGPWFGYSFDTNKFFDEYENSADKLYNHRRRYFAILPKIDHAYIDYRLFLLNFYPPYPNHDGIDVRTNKTEYARVEGLLDTVIDSLAEKTVVLPMCEYGCAY